MLIGFFPHQDFDKIIIEAFLHQNEEEEKKNVNIHTETTYCAIL